MRIGNKEISIFALKLCIVKSQIYNKKCKKYAKMSSRILSDFFYLFRLFHTFQNFNNKCLLI